MTVLRAIDLFCGAGGFALGMKRAGIEIIKSVDYDPAAVAVHEANLGNGDVPPPSRPLFRKIGRPPYRKDEPRPIRRGHIVGNTEVHMIVDLAQVIENGPDFAALEPDIIFGGPPCQPYSQAGKMLGDDDPRSALTDAFAITVVCARPKYFVMENVPGVRDWKAYKRSIGMLRRHGYGLTEVALDASYYGNAQRRQRWICAGCLDEGDGWLLEYLEQYRSPRQRTVADELGADFGALALDCLVDLPAAIPAGNHYRLRNADRTVLSSSPGDARLFFCRPGGERSAGICRTDSPAPTITGKSTQGIGNNYRPDPTDPIDLRKLPHPTFAQFAQLAGFPSEWKWNVPVKFRRKKDGTLVQATEITDTQIRQMLGNSVAPSLAECIGLAITDHALGEVAGPRSSKAPERALERVEPIEPEPFKVPSAYISWLRENRGMTGKILTQEVSNLKRVKRYVAGRSLTLARDELFALERAPSPSFQELKTQNRSTLRGALRTFAEWQDMNEAAKNANAERRRQKEERLRKEARDRIDYQEHLIDLEGRKEELAREKEANAQFFDRQRQKRSHEQDHKVAAD